MGIVHKKNETALWKMVDYHFAKQHCQMQETRNNCFGFEKM